MRWDSSSELKDPKKEIFEAVDVLKAPKSAREKRIALNELWAYNNLTTTLSDAALPKKALKGLESEQFLKLQI